MGEVDKGKEEVELMGGDLIWVVNMQSNIQKIHSRVVPEMYIILLTHVIQKHSIKKDCILSDIPNNSTMTHLR